MCVVWGLGVEGGRRGECLRVYVDLRKTLMYLLLPLSQSYSPFLPISLPSPSFLPLPSPCLPENIMIAHNYTSTIPQTAAAAVNAGTCLEDGNSMDNVFSHIGDAVSMVMSIHVLS